MPQAASVHANNAMKPMRARISHEDSPITIKGQVHARGYGGERVVIEMLDHEGVSVYREEREVLSDDETLGVRHHMRAEEGGVSFYRLRVTERDVPVYTYKSTPQRDEWTVARSALGKGGARWLPVRLPGLYAGDVFRTMARSHGIALSRPEVSKRAPGGTVLARRASPPPGPSRRRASRQGSGSRKPRR